MSLSWNDELFHETEVFNFAFHETNIIANSLKHTVVLNIFSETDRWFKISKPFVNLIFSKR